MHQSKFVSSISNSGVLIATLTYCILIKFLFIMYAPPLPDEAYYWLWSKRIDFSYYDHPPLSMWLQHLFSSLISNKKLLLRIVPVIASIIVLLIIYLWVKRLSFYRNIEDYLITILLATSIPVFNIFLSISFPDPVLICTLVLSGFFYHLYSQEKRLFNNNKHFCWYLSVLFFALALLSKYNALLFGIGIFVHLILKKRERENLIFSKHFLLAIILVLLIFSPVIYWNARNDFASFGFNLDKRLSFEFNWYNIIENLFIFSFSLVLSFSPVLFMALFKNYQKTKNKKHSSMGIEASISVLFVTIIFCLILTLFAQPLYYWAIPAFVMLIPYLSALIKKRAHRIIHCFYGLFITTILFFNTAIYPVSLFFGKADRETAILYGWDSIAKKISTEKQRYDIKKILFSDYRLGSLYAFHSEDFSIDVLMAKRETQFDLWRDEDQQLDSLILVDKDFPLNSKIRSIYTDIKFLKDIDVKIKQSQIKTYELYLGINGN